jgi:hypothetical protein
MLMYLQVLRIVVDSGFYRYIPTSLTRESREDYLLQYLFL